MNVHDEINDCFHQINCPSDHGEPYSVILQEILLLHTSVPKLHHAAYALCYASFPPIASISSFREHSHEPYVD